MSEQSREKFTARDVGPLQEGASSEEREYTINGEYREYKKVCRVCHKEFTTGIPRSWFNKNGRFNKEQITRIGISVEEVRDMIDSEICAFCKNNKADDKEQ